MMQSFTEGIDKIYYDLDNIEDLNSRLYFEANPQDHPNWKDYGKYYWDKIKKPTAAVTALGALALWYRAFSNVPEMDPATKAQHAFDIYQHTIAIRGANLDKAAKEYVFTVDQLYGDSDTIPPEVTKLVQQIKAFNAQWRDKERIEVFKQRLVHWDRELEFDKTETKIDAWAAKSDDLATAPPVSPQQPDIPPPPPKAKSLWAPGLSKPAGWKDPRGFQLKKRKQPRKESNMKTFETFENEVLNWVTETDSKFDQDIFNILDPLEAQIESGEYTQEEIVDIVTQELSSQLGAEISTEEGARIEQKVEHFYTMIGLDSIPADRRSRDYLDSRSTTTAPVVDENIPTGIPRQVEGQPVVHTDDDFLLFLEWVIRQVDENGELKYTARSVVDIITSPHDGWVTSLYKKYKNQSQRVEEDPYL